MFETSAGAEEVLYTVRATDPGLSGQDVLSAAEHERLAGMHEGARPAYVTARSMLRHKLGAHMGLLPSAVPLFQEGSGRVHLKGFSDHEPPFFSVSHTGSAEEGLAAVAVAESTRIGLDIQQLDHDIDWKRVAERRLPEKDFVMLNVLPEEEAMLLFFTLWAIRESFVKLEDGQLMPYLRNVHLDLTAPPTERLVAPTPGGLEEAFIWYDYVPERELVLAMVAAKPIKVALDCDIESYSRRPDPLQNTGL